MGWGCLAYKSYWVRDHFLLVARSDHTTGSRNIKPEVVFKVQKMAQYASFCLIMGPFKGELPVFCQIMAHLATMACAEMPSLSRAQQYVCRPG